MMKVKKILSFVLVTVMLLSMFAVPSAAVEGETDTVVVHYYNENGWENPYIYYYSDDSLPITWPGEAMTSEGNGWYSFTITSSSQARVIFSNNGANQYPAQSEQGLLISGEQWFRSGTLFDQNPDLTRITVHYYNSNQWSNPYIYYYTDTELPITWPGVAMISDGNGWYSYDIYGFEDVKVIFSNNGANQSPAQGQAGYTVTSDGWFINDTWYDAEPDGITVHYYNYDDWANVNIYYYNGVIEGTEWVGVPMYADGDGWYTYKIYGYDEARVL
ncbi:MAG: starch-binding protein, partial [Acutalibacteraceae bacterium]